jgi:Ca2+-binding RTX toxin-like protein
VDSQKFHRIARLDRYTSGSAAYRLKFQSDWSSKERHLFVEVPRYLEGGNEVKRAGIFLTLMSVMVLVFAGVALAALIEGNNRPNTLVGTPKGDAIYGYGGADNIDARGGGDALRLGGGRDKGYGERGDDYIRAVDGSKDEISCGPGSDRATANPGDKVAEGCEVVIREGIRVD